MVDSNWVRILHRAREGEWMADYRYDPRLQGIAQAIVEAHTEPREINWAMLDLGALVCRPANPLCGECPLVGSCAHGGRHARPNDSTVSNSSGT